MPRHDPLYEWAAQVATYVPDRPAGEFLQDAEWGGFGVGPVGR